MDENGMELARLVFKFKLYIYCVINRENATERIFVVFQDSRFIGAMLNFNGEITCWQTRSRLFEKRVFFGNFLTGPVLFRS